MGCGGAKETKAASSPPTTGGSATKTDSLPNGDQIVMQKYKMLMSKDDHMGEGTSSICRKGKEIATGKDVAIKVYKDQKKGSASKHAEITLQKFKRQIAVLKELLEPFPTVSDPTLWHERLAKVQPDQVFMVLLDNSVDASGEPGADAKDGVLYVITELAQYSLKDFIGQRREQRKPLSKDSIKNITKAIMMAMASLHAKGFVHLDMKPENMMMFNGRLKVIDVDGCVRSGTRVSISDSTISFSPCYCAPEWARFLIKEEQSSIVASPLLDAWSVGMTICELVTLDAILKPMYANFLRNAHSHREAGFLFMEWLGGAKNIQLPKAVEKFEPEFVKVLKEGLLVSNNSARKSCAQCLSFEYIATAQDKIVEAPAIVERTHRARPDDDSVEQPLHKGILFKLDSKGDPKNLADWRQRDMWIAHNHSLCYYSQKDGKRLVLLTGDKVTSAEIMKVGPEGFAKENVIQITYHSDHDDEKRETVFLAAESPEKQGVWVRKLKMTANMEMIVTMKLGKEMESELNSFRVAVKNRRIKVDEEDKAQFEARFQDKLWKLKGEGNKQTADDWFCRDMWVSKNHSLVYHSVKEERNLVYYTTADLHRAEITKLSDAETCKKFAFKVQLPANNGVEFDPGLFAAESEEARDKWIKQLSTE